MTIASEITKLNTNLTNSYTACQNKGATMPTNQNFDNLATCVSSIPTATEPTLASLTVTPSTTDQTLTPPSGTDGYNTVTVSAVTASIDSDIVAENIKSGVNILGVSGTVTELAGETRTVSITSTSGNTFTPSSGKNGITSIKCNPSNKTLTITPSTSKQTKTVPSGYSGYGTVKCNAVTSAIDSNIKAGNIKSGVKILGVTGTYSGGTTPTGTLSITQNGTYDVTNYASANVSVSGGGTPPYTQYAYPELVNKNCYVLSNSNVIPLSFKGVDTQINGYSGNQYSLMTIVEFRTGFGIEDYNDYTSEFSYINNSWTSLTIKNITNTLPSDYWEIDNQAYVTHINLNFENYCKTGTIKFQNKALGRNGDLQTVRIRNMSNLVLGNAFYDCAYLREVDVSMIDSMPLALALGGTQSTGGAFTNCTSLRSLSFNSLKPTSFGSVTSQFNYMLKGVTGCTVHFPSNLQSVIGSWSSVTSGFSGTNTTVLFDLPATT